MTSTDTSMFFNILLFLGSMTNGIALATGIFLILRALEFFDKKEDFFFNFSVGLNILCDMIFVFVAFGIVCTLSCPILYLIFTAMFVAIVGIGYGIFFITPRGKYYLLRAKIKRINENIEKVCKLEIPSKEIVDIISQMEKIKNNLEKQLSLVLVRDTIDVVNKINKNYKEVNVKRDIDKLVCLYDLRKDD